MSVLNQYAPMNGAIVDSAGRPTAAFQIWLRELWLRTGGVTGNSGSVTQNVQQVVWMQSDTPEDGVPGMPGPQGPPGPAGGPAIWIQSDEGDASPVFIVISP